jgi:hypothetical protein
MSKYIEIPQKPATVYAVQYTGMENGVPLFNEPAPNWVVGALAKGHLQVIDGGLHCRGKSLDLGSWLVVEDGDIAGDRMRSVLFANFVSLYRPARKKPVARKPRAVKAAA